MDYLQLMADLHKRQNRQGPGGDMQTKLALNLTGMDQTEPLKVADIGCGTGASTLVLANELNAEITAVDFLGDFLDILKKRAAEAGLSNKISTLKCEMEDLPFDEGVFDLIWSEGAIYNMGFESGTRSWKRYLKPGGFLVVSEITWITKRRPEEIQEYWSREYTEVDLASAKFTILENAGYSPIGYFTLPEQCWTENYYLPIQQSLHDFLKRNSHTEKAKEIAELEKAEFELFKKFKNYFNYGVYVARKVD